MGNSIKKAPRGRPFEAGNRASPGRPPIPTEVREMARAAGPAAIAYLVAVMSDGYGKCETRMRAAELLLDRGFGKPVQSSELAVSPLFPQQVEIRLVRPE